MSMRVSVVVLLTLLALAACGGGDDSSGGSDESWCQLAQRIEDTGDEYDAAFGSGPESLGQALDDFGSLLDEARQVAPDEIRAAVDTTADGIARFAELLGDGDLSMLDDDALAELEAMSAEMDTATAEIEAYNLRECGITPDPDDSGDASGFDEVTVADGDVEVDGDDAPGDDPTDDPVDDPVAEPVAEPVDEVDEVDEVDASVGDGGSDDDPVFVGDSNSDWCVAARQVEAASDDLETIGFADPVQVEETLGEVLDLFGVAMQYAPPELAADLEVSFDSFQQVDDALRAADYDFLNADLSALDDVDGSVARANERIEQYNVQVCGFDPEDDEVLGDDEDSAFDPTAGTIREQTVAELVNQGFTTEEAECIIDKIDFTDPDLIADTSAIIAIFDDCDISLERLAELAG